MLYEQAWLAYRRIDNFDNKFKLNRLYIDFKHEAPIYQTVIRELEQALKAILNESLQIVKNIDEAGLALNQREEYGLGEGYELRSTGGQLQLKSSTARGLLYGIFALIRQLQMETVLDDLRIREIPDNPLRIVNHWDNMDGSIERGYSGNSFFFQDNRIVITDRTVEYARLNASVGINTVVINNVNVRGEAVNLIEDKHSSGINKLADVFDAYGIELYLCVSFAAPIERGNLETADPLNPEVREWWSKKMAEIHKRSPKIAGYMIKADSEGNPGPEGYGRTQADGANMLGEAVKPFGGRIIWRCFVYNCQQDWRDYKTDRARSGYETFAPLDGTFRDNVILQIKNGPMDFQVRESVSPLFGNLRKTNQILEVQIAQEYTGQQKHLCYLIPMFKEILNFRTFCCEDQDSVANIISGRAFNQKSCGMAAVINTGDDPNWTGHDLAAVNWYGFGCLSFNTSLSPEAIADEWIACTYGSNPLVKEVIKKMLLNSWKTYEKYTSPLGIGWMVEPNVHYGPNVDGYEYQRWGTYHRADSHALGVDRSMAGTGYTGQYHSPNKEMYNSPETCPEELLLFFHRIPYMYQLKNGKTLIQHIYDTHFEGVEEVAEMVGSWQKLQGLVPDKVFRRVSERLSHQLSHAKEWRDQINTYFYRKSGIDDEQGRRIY